MFTTVLVLPISTGLVQNPHSTSLTPRNMHHRAPSCRVCCWYTDAIYMCGERLIPLSKLQDRRQTMSNFLDVFVFAPVHPLTRAQEVEHQVLTSRAFHVFVLVDEVASQAVAAGVLCWPTALQKPRFVMDKTRQRDNNSPQILFPFSVSSSNCGHAEDSCGDFTSRSSTSSTTGHAATYINYLPSVAADNCRIQSMHS